MSVSSLKECGYITKDVPKVPECDERIQAAAAKVGKQFNSVTRSLLVNISIDFIIVLSAVVLAIGLVELWRWAR
jgi:hypothetical protein